MTAIVSFLSLSLFINEAIFNAFKFKSEYDTSSLEILIDFKFEYSLNLLYKIFANELNASNYL